MIRLTKKDGTVLEDTCGACNNCEFCDLWQETLDFVRKEYSTSLKEGLVKYEGTI